MSCAYPFLVIVLISSIYGVFLADNLLPQIHALSGKDPEEDYFYQPGKTEVVLVFVTFHLLFSLLISCFVLASQSGPGYIPTENEQDRTKWREGDFVPRYMTKMEDNLVKEIISDLNYPGMATPKIKELLRRIPVVERKKKYGDHRHCGSCNQYKPDRTHHCRVCDRCILRMDHHCPWISNCVGFRNYKYFLLLLFYATCCTGFVLGGMFRRLIYAFRPIINTADFLLEDLPVVIVWLISLFLFVALCMFLSFHINLTLSAMSTIELREKKNNDDPFVVHRFKVAHIKYDRGWYSNLVHVLGPTWTWFLPIFPGGDGTYSTYNALSYDEYRKVKPTIATVLCPCFEGKPELNKPGAASSYGAEGEAKAMLSA